MEHAIRAGVAFLKREQRDDGSWAEIEADAKPGTTSLVTLALLTAGEKPDSPTIRKALEYLRGFGPDDLRSTYAISFQTMVFAAAEPERDQLRIAANVEWLERAQIRPGDSGLLARHVELLRCQVQPGDNSNTQYALLGLHAASEAGVPVKPEVWDWRGLIGSGLRRMTGAGRTPLHSPASSASMTCPGSPA